MSAWPRMENDSQSKQHGPSWLGAESEAHAEGWLNCQESQANELAELEGWVESLVERDPAENLPPLGSATHSSNEAAPGSGSAWPEHIQAR